MKKEITVRLGLNPDLDSGYGDLTLNTLLDVLQFQRDKYLNVDLRISLDTDSEELVIYYEQQITMENE